MPTPFEPGGQIHSTDPFAVAQSDRSPVRQFRGRLTAPVTLWTAYRVQPTAEPAGLTVSSILVADGEPGRLLGLIDPESDLWTAVSASGRFTVAVLGPQHEQLADQFAGLMPAPGGPFQGYTWQPTGYGPLLDGVDTWAGCTVDASRPYGWGRLVEATIVAVSIGSGAAPTLAHLRGRYHSQ